MNSDKTAKPATTEKDSPFEAEIEQHDAAIAGRGIEIWVGAEPTFTKRSSESPEWLSEPLGGDKHPLALRMAGTLLEQHPGSAILRTVGRQYAEEKIPRWSVGLLARRDGNPIWPGPPDPLGEPSPPVEPQRLDGFWELLQQRLVERGWPCRHFRVSDPLDRRLLFRLDGKPVSNDEDPRLQRASVHTQKTPHDGLADPLAERGLMLVALGELELTPKNRALCVELPAFGRVSDFLACLEVIGLAASEAEIGALVLQGHPPPVDADVSWISITPDPAVIEVNAAPQPDLRRFLADQRELFKVAKTLGLSPYRLQYNGTVSDSGGGGQFTLGGRTPGESPFFVKSTLLPRLVRYLNRHPSLSYLFAPDFVGGASQSPRPDEGIRDAFHELALALWHLDSIPKASPEMIWGSLAHFLADPSGNRHRSELNIEKLWNPHLPGRGQLGLVEFRAFRMPRSPQRAVAIAALLRSITAMLAGANTAPGLRDWGDALHDKYALPFYLHQDLQAVFDDLAATGFGLGEKIKAMLFRDPGGSRWQASHAGCELAIEPAKEFWPLVGDVASQEGGGSRLMDSSTLRLQVSLRKISDKGPPLSGWRLQVGSQVLPLFGGQDGQQGVRLIALRYRDFVPWRGLHPSLKPFGPLQFTLSHPALEDALQATLYAWRPDGTPYDGLPQGLDAAADRRKERLVTRIVSREKIPAPQTPPEAALSGYTYDLRYLATPTE